MTGAEFKKARKALGLGVVEFGRKLGLLGSDNTISVYVRRMEKGQRSVRPWMERRLGAMERERKP